MSVERLGPPHRKNRDGTYDAICPVCYRTIATREHEGDLTEDELNHICISGDRPRFLQKATPPAKGRSAV